MTLRTRRMAMKVRAVKRDEVPASARGGWRRWEALLSDFESSKDEARELLFDDDADAKRAYMALRANAKRKKRPVTISRRKLAIYVIKSAA
jgi:hypothetical protein